MINEDVLLCLAMVAAVLGTFAVVELQSVHLFLLF